MSCRFLDKDWSFEVADDGFVHGVKSYIVSNNGYLCSPYQFHMPTDYTVVSDRGTHKLLEGVEGYSIKRGIHAYLNKDRQTYGIFVPVKILPEDIVVVGAFSEDDSIVAMKVELVKQFVSRGKEYTLEKTTKGIRPKEIKNAINTN